MAWTSPLRTQTDACGSRRSMPRVTLDPLDFSLPFQADVAQPVEQRFRKPPVGSSSLPVGSGNSGVLPQDRGAEGSREIGGQRVARLRVAPEGGPRRAGFAAHPRCGAQALVLTQEIANP